ncbi:hypothetical protein ABPG75_006957 [Micractinium tetrahymenae]
MARLPDWWGRYPIHQAAECGNLLALRLLLQAAPETAGVALSSDCEVAEAHRAALARGELSQPTGIKQLDIALQGRTPLHMAAGCHPEAVELLLRAAPQAALRPDQQGRLPLHCAASSGSAGSIQLLLAVAPEAALRTASPSYIKGRLQRLHSSRKPRSKGAEVAASASAQPLSETASRRSATPSLRDPLR